MPLIGLTNGARVNSLEVSDELWAELRTPAGRDTLTMPGCGMPALARVSKLGFRHFAHRANTDCEAEHKPESPQHMAMKAAVADLVNMEPGWEATIEFQGPDGAWVADVLAEHPCGRRIAFEVQLSGQTPDEFQFRSQRYFDAGILPVWITPLEVNAGVVLPVVRTSWRKSTPLPVDLAELLDWPNRSGNPTIRHSVGMYLDLGYVWSDGDVTRQLGERQRERLEREREYAAELAAQERRKKWLEDQIEKVRSLNTKVKVPEEMVAKNAPLALWVTQIGCWKCSAQMIIWQAQNAPELAFSPLLANPRPEDSVTARRLLQEWAVQARPTASKANIKVSYTKASGSSYPAFCCRDCGAVQGHVFLTHLLRKNWSPIATLPPGRHPKPQRRPVRQPVKKRSFEEMVIAKMTNRG